MATTEFEIGAYAKVDRDSRTHKTKNGQYIVVIKTTVAKKGDFEVFDNESDAKAAQAHVRGTGALSGRPTPSLVLTNMSKTQISNVTANVEDVMKPLVLASTYDGKVAKAVTLPIIIGGIYQGSTVTVDATIEHAGTTLCLVRVQAWRSHRQGPNDRG